MRTAPPNGWDFTLTMGPFSDPWAVALRSRASITSSSPGCSKRTLLSVATLTRRLSSSVAPIPGTKCSDGLGFIGCKGNGLIDGHGFARLPGFHPFISRQSGFHELAVLFHFYTVGRPPVTSCRLQDGFRGGKQGRAPISLSLAAFQTGQSGQAFRNAASIAQTPEHSQAFAEL